MVILYYDLVAFVDLAEFFGGIPFVLLENAVEVRDIVEAGTEANVGYRLIARH